MSKSTKPKDEAVEPVIETPQVEETTPVVEETPVTVDEPVLEEPTHEETIEPIFVPEIPSQVEESAPVVEEGRLPLHKLNKIRS